MGGRLQVKSEPKEGSTFWFELDLSIADHFEGAQQVIEQNIVGYQGDKKRILVVDDKSENRAMLTHMLMPLGFEIAEAVDGQDCLEKVTKFKPHAVLMDLRMPGMDGLETMRWLRKMPIGQQIVMIAVSASAFEHNREESRMAGANDFLPKPFRLQQLLDMLALHLKLEWHVTEYSGPSAEETAETIIVPQDDDLTQLYELAMRGDIRKIVTHAERLSRTGYAAFAVVILNLAQEFKIK
jgi:CheY-like chemotaxis protein